MTRVIDTAKRLAKNGLSVIPIRPDGSKAPAIPEWKEFQSTIADPATLEAMFSAGVGIGIIGGKVSGNLEALDFEAGAPVKEWADQVKSYPGGADLLGRLPAVKTPTGGWHFPYRCRDGVEGNQKLAQTHGREGTESGSGARPIEHAADGNRLDRHLHRCTRGG